MIYSNLEYFCLLNVTVILFLLARGSYPVRFALLVLASLLFYSWLSVIECAVFLFVVVVSWGFLALAHFDPMRKSAWLTAGIVTMTLHLFLWKYLPWLSESAYHFFPTRMNGAVFLFPLPAGISFFTLQGIAYLADYGRGKVEMMSFSKYLLFKSFFPQLVAGPIVRAETMLPQLNRLASPRNEDIWNGLLLFALGFAKKMLIADRVAPLIDDVYAHPGLYDRTSLWLAAVGFTVQLWADFSGYTDMGRGSARLLGIHLPENFLAPYLSRKPSEFWRRWHITLSQWIRDYIYFPLGGSRGGLARVLTVSMITMVLSGLWHGAALSYVLWGVFNGWLLLVERVMRGRWPWRLTAWMEMAHFYFLFVISMVIFRAVNLTEMGHHLRGLLFSAGAHTADFGVPILSGLAAMLAFHVVTYAPLDQTAVVTPLERCGQRWSMSEWPVRLVIAIGLALALNLTLFFRAGGEAFSFIYFKF